MTEIIVMLIGCYCAFRLGRKSQKLESIIRKDNTDTVLGKDLIFLSSINRDGKGVTELEPDKDMSHLDKTNFKIASLSITYGTYIASEFSSFVVKFK